MSTDQRSINQFDNKFLISLWQANSSMKTWSYITNTFKNFQFPPWTIWGKESALYLAFEFSNNNFLNHVGQQEGNLKWIGMQK